LLADYRAMPPALVTRRSPGAAGSRLRSPGADDLPYAQAVQRRVSREHGAFTELC
jgi:hypothetical protein